MSARHLPVGKLPRGLIERLLADGPSSSDVVLGPAVGEDACVLEVGTELVVAASDPITFTRRGAGRQAVIVNANDIAVTGGRPRWFLATLLLPPGTVEEHVEELFAEIGSALSDLGASLVGGHTEITPAVTQPVVIGEMLGTVPDRRVVSTAGASPRDVVLQIGPAPIEGAAVLVEEFRPRLGGVAEDILAAAADAIQHPGISIVAAALQAAELGATAMHDPTEGGLAAALNEMASAAHVRFVIDRSRLLWFEPGLAVCRALDTDPWATLASGSLLATFAPPDASAAARALELAGLEVATIGEARDGAGVVDAEGELIAWPERDEVARVLEAASSRTSPLAQT